MAKTKEKVDVLNSQELVDKLKSIIENLDCSEENRSFALNGSWGSGKTFLLDMFEKAINENNEYIIINFNSWQNDFYKEPLVAILVSIIDVLNKELKAKKFKDSVTKKIFQECLKTLSGLAEGIAQYTLGTNVVKATKSIFNLFKKTKEKVDEVNKGNKISTDFDTNQVLKNAIEITRKNLKMLDKKVIFIVDELDRCLPEYAITVLERTHHIFDGLANSISIFALDMSMLEKIIDTYYGSKVSASSYIEKFIEFSVPMGKRSLTEKCEVLIQEYLSNFEINSDQEKQDLIKFISLLMEKINIRKQIRYFNKLNILHQLLIKEKSHITLCYFEIFCMIFYVEYAKETGMFKVNYFTPKDDRFLEGYLKEIYPKIFGAIQLKDFSVNGVKHDSIYISSLSEIDKVLFYMIRYIQHKPNGDIILVDKENKEIENEDIIKITVKAEVFYKNLNYIN